MRDRRLRAANQQQLPGAAPVRAEATRRGEHPAILLLSPAAAARAPGGSRVGGFRIEKQFFLPMVVHRTMATRKLSEALERAAGAVGLTALLGAPAVVAAERTQDDG
jgi:hypothetical protein